MKNFLTLLFLFIAVAALAQLPVQRTSWTTNLITPSFMDKNGNVTLAGLTTFTNGNNANAFYINRAPAGLGRWALNDTTGNVIDFFDDGSMDISPLNGLWSVDKLGNFTGNGAALTGVKSATAVVATNDAFGHPFTNAYVWSGNGNSTNEYIRNAISTNETIVSGIWKPTNIWTGIGTIGGVSGTSVITNDTPGAFSGIHPGDNFAAGNQQLTVQWVNNPSNVFVFETLAFPWSKSNYVVYPNAQYGTDINGTLVACAVENDGSLSVIGRFGGNSGKINLFSDRIGGAWAQQINGGGAWTLSTKGNNGGGVITVDTNAQYESINVVKDAATGGTTALRSLTNTPGAGFGALLIQGRVIVGNTSATAAGTGLTVQSNVFVGITVTATNGFGSVATNTYSMGTLGYTNATGKNIRISGLTGVSVIQSNAVLQVQFSRGTLTTAEDVILQPRECIYGTSMAAQSMNDF